MDSFIEKVFGNKIIIILVSLLLIIALVYYGISKINSRDFNNKKIDKNKYVVYTKETRQKDFYIQDIPFINLTIVVEDRVIILLKILSNMS